MPDSAYSGEEQDDFAWLRAHASGADADRPTTQPQLRLLKSAAARIMCPYWLMGQIAACGRGTRPGL